MKYVVISVKPETRRELLKLRVGMEMRSYDDVLKILLDRAKVKERTITLNEL